MMSNANHSSSRRSSETKTGRVWVIADQITRKQGRIARRPEVMKAYAAEGGNPNTASTQYSNWRKDYEAGKPHRAPWAPGAKGKVTLVIGSDGRLLVPLEFRSMMMIGEDGKVQASLEDGELRIISPKLALRRIQQVIGELDQGQGSAVDELIAERRIEGNRT